MKVEINKNDLEKLNQSFVKLDEFARFRALDKFASESFEKATKLADKHTKTGNLGKSLYLRKQSESSYVMGSDSNIANYASCVHFGTKPHVIKPKNRKFLRWASGDKFIFAKKVNHPGYKGDAFFYNALNENLKEFKKWVDRELDRI